MVQPHNNQGSFDQDFLDHFPEELIQQPLNSFHCLSTFVAATEASMLFSALLPMGGSDIASNSQPVPCSDSNSNCNNTTSITNMPGIKNPDSGNACTIVAGGILVGG